MNRRRFCAGLLTGVAVGLGGCRRSSGDDPASGSAQANRTTTRTDAEPMMTREPVSLAETGIPADICDAEVIEGFNIEEIVDPAFASSWRDYDIDARYVRDEDDGLTDRATVVGREHDGNARAYPISVLWHHEIVNDTHGRPIIVTFCSICRSGLVAERVVAGEPTRFGVSGQLWKPPDRFIPASAKAGRAFGADRWNGTEPVQVRNGANLVMYDELTGSFWSQALARAICGPATGTRLPIVPSELTSWSEWRAEHPETEVLLPPPHSSVNLDTSGSG